jgi:hypothetical protein
MIINQVGKHGVNRDQSRIDFIGKIIGDLNNFFLPIIVKEEACVRLFE